VHRRARTKLSQPDHVNGKKECSFLKKKPKNFYLFSLSASKLDSIPGAKVFCFFFSKKKPFLPR
jgi:hypothetical protein